MRTHGCPCPTPNSAGTGGGPLRRSEVTFSPALPCRRGGGPLSFPENASGGICPKPLTTPLTGQGSTCSRPRRTGYQGLEPFLTLATRRALPSPLAWLSLQLPRDSPRLLPSPALGPQKSPVFALLDHKAARLGRRRQRVWDLMPSFCTWGNGGS